ncbi:hypothetical protein ACIPIC_18405 [Streptomyces collinus]|uniref:hypothetical protein n=1 Tax=Streptomyces collinus TaxID=42684 RepID=UPI0037F50386
MSHSRTASAVRGMSEAEVLALPASVPLEQANRAIGIGRTRGYQRAKNGTYPIEVLRHGVAYRCRRRDILEYLGITEPAASLAR